MGEFWRREGGGRIGFAFAENAFERGAGEPDEVGAGVHVERDGLRRSGSEGERESVIAAGGEREGHLAVVVVVVVVVVAAKAGGGAAGSGFQEVVCGGGGVVLSFGERVG